MVPSGQDRHWGDHDIKAMRGDINRCELMGRREMLQSTLLREAKPVRPSSSHDQHNLLSVPSCAQSASRSRLGKMPNDSQNRQPGAPTAQNGRDCPKLVIGSQGGIDR
jgi:hypothetical protein